MFPYAGTVCQAVPAVIRTSLKLSLKSANNYVFFSLICYMYLRFARMHTNEELKLTRQEQTVAPVLKVLSYVTAADLNLGKRASVNKV
jgi:hypothetical protein